MTTITRRFEFDSAHRVYGHEGHCKFLHGHRYVAEVTVQGPKLDQLGRVIDFSVLKQEVGSWINDNWDHNMLLSCADPLLDLPPESGVWQGKKPYIMDMNRSINRNEPDNPTAENIAETLFKVARDLLLQYDIQVVHVRIYETPACWADYSGS